jgi:hypothetical protein
MTMQEATESKPAWKQHWVQPIQVDDEKKLDRMSEGCSNDQHYWRVSMGFPHCTVRLTK